MVFVTMFGGGVPQTLQRSGSVHYQSSAGYKQGPSKVAGTHRGGRRVMCDFRDCSGLRRVEIQAQVPTTSYPSDTLDDLRQNSRVPGDTC